ncbi:MAG: hypothetical protein ICV57_05445 [Rubrobacter sp.]|nr:hypothetical protein [Rubrobacter sp.]
MLLKVRLDDVRAILKHALDTVAEHPEILKNLTQALDDLLTGRQGDALAPSIMSLRAWRMMVRSTSC